MSAEQRLVELSIDLPSAPTPVASYVTVVQSGPFAFVSGQVALDDGTPMWTGKLGAEVSVEHGADAARRCGLQILAALRSALGSLDRVSRIVKVTVFVASAPGFTEQPKVANGASDLFVEVFGDAGRHARAAVGVAELPLDAPVEVDVVAEVTG
ncbi:MAG TPA: RidA family protein [Actinomycetota bacterium]|nr:RidA family protein [Actinomycetota bacterium]